MKENFKIFMARVLVKHINFFKISFGDVIQNHIEEELSKKSVVVCQHCKYRNLFIIDYVGTTWNYS